MKRRIIFFITILIIFNFIMPFFVFAVGDGNIDSGGGGMGSGTSQNKWSPGNDGVRVSIVRVDDYSIVTTPIDLTNKQPPSTIFHFGKVSKLQYNGGRNLSPIQGSYSYINPSQSIPRIVSTEGKNNIEAIKSYFTDEQVIRSIASNTGMNYDTLINGEYKLFLEPIAYYTFQGVMIATTATEAVMYDEKLSGGLRTKMVSLSHKNLPLAMFLEVGDLGYHAWSGSTSTPASNSDIKNYLGLGIVRFKEKPEEPIISTYDYEYRVNTEVITSVMVSGGQSDPDNPTYVSFDIGGRTYNVGNIYYPRGDSQLAWVKWTTPSTEQNMTIHVNVNGPGGTAKSIINIKIVDLDKNPPPNPVADDRNDSFSYVPIPRREEKTNANWSIWRPWWQEYWVWHSTGEDSGYWCDHGWWEFDLDQYSARLSADMRITNDSKNPTGNGSTFKSGYGINQLVNVNINSNQSSAITYPQNAVSYFPEFRYETYWRLLDKTSSGSSPKFEFKKNNYSTYKNRTHFTPIWMPDGAYTVNTWVIDVWTPDGMLSMNLTDSLTIRGNLWQDWHIAPLKP
ncbi:hypothetical protein SAMN02745784_02723 [Tissierella praeacuta DSM 18095]|uniref:Uncharacterized protein n=1 Tax=Tissierella praeacuta DSM 18095 TaxID=1123404 RepID=A0A1M4YPT9_9FIRM|nr:hypothetical protein [Tissierella praeacuta]SHF07522.1 hypothetical protein SAMN02745784_02723 [Tissierella praeacuta DSM 18095]SUP02390.1 Uncharacterised protein [Tissierella praeacuta]